MILRFASAVIAAAWLFWQFGASATAEVTLPELTAFSAFGDNVNAAASPALVFYRRTAAGQYNAYGLSSGGEITRMLRLPGEKLSKADQTTIPLAGKEGYLTAPENGAYYIWYPQIGQQVYVFNEQGNFLWEKDESHYLHVLPHGRYIMAAAGDHSRMIFMNPDFKTQADFQGVLFTRFITDDNPDLKSAQVCLGSLDGEIIVAHLDRKIYFRQKLGYALKSLTCDFATGELAAIVEKTVEVDKKPMQKDFLVRAKFSLKVPKEEKPLEAMRQIEAELDIILSAELPIRTVMASPLVLTADSLCFLQEAPTGSLTEKKLSSPAAETPPQSGLALYFTRGKKSALQHVILSAGQANTQADNSPDLWKSTPVKLRHDDACLFTHRSGRLLIANHRGILLERHDLPVERAIGRGDGIFLQNEKGILTLR